MCLHGSPSVLSLSQLLPGIVGPEAQGGWGGFTGVPQGGAIHAIYVEVCVCVCVRKRQTREREECEALR